MHPYNLPHPASDQPERRDLRPTPSQASLQLCCFRIVSERGQFKMGRAALRRKHISTAKASKCRDPSKLKPCFSQNDDLAVATWAAEQWLVVVVV